MNQSEQSFGSPCQSWPDTGVHLNSRGEITLQIRSAITVSVVDIPIIVHDVIPLIDQARAYSDRIAVIGFGEIVKAARVALMVAATDRTA